MQEFNIVGKTTVTAEVKAQVDNSPLALPAPEGFGTVEDFQLFSEAQNNSTDSLKQNTALMKEFGDIMPDIIKQLRAMNDAVARTSQNLPAIGKVKTVENQRIKNLEESAKQNLLSLANNGSNLVQSYASGNVTGMALTGVNAITNTSNNLSKMAEAADMTGLAKGLIAGGVVAAIAGAVIKGGDALAEKFIQEMPVIYGAGRAFGSMSDFDSMVTWQKMNEYNKNTNLDIDTFQELAQSLRKQGVGNTLGTPDEQLSLVGNIAQTTSRWAYATGGDVNQYARLAGTMARYGGSKDVVGDFNYLVAAGKASGLNDTQIPEFLSGIQKVMEDGIAKGFTRSATDVADTLLMFSKMSGNNAFWQGEQGARLLNQANNGLSSAVGLSKTSDIIAYNAIARAYTSPEAQKAALGSDLFLEDGNYVNKMMLLEQGLNENNFGALLGAIQSAEPGNTDAQIERIREMFGVNYSGASRILQLYAKKGANVTDTDITNVTEAPEYQNKETRYQQSVNDIKAAVVEIGEGAAELKIEGMELVKNNLSKITGWLGVEYGDKAKEKEINDMLENLTPAQQTWLAANPEVFLSGKSEEELLEILKNLSEWNGFGRIEGITEDNVFNTEELVDNALTGESAEGAWSLNHIIKKNKQGQMYDFINFGFGDEILDYYNGNTADAEAAIKYLADPKNKNSKDVRGFIEDKSSDIVYTKDEQNETLKMILNILKEGINVNEYN